jgi:S1-C subfamily serine protease
MWRRSLLALALLALSNGAASAEDRAQTIFREARDYTVRIRTQIDTPFMEDERGSFEGAGFLVDAERGWVVTNAHVVGQSPSTVQAAFADESLRPARKIYVDSFTDVAILEIPMEGRRHRAAAIQCDQVPGIGEAVGVFGHPQGYYFTGTRGIISGRTDREIVDLLQTDATVDHGNSGGPMIALADGRIVGIASAGYQLRKEDKVNFATPMKDVCRILELLRKGVPAEPPNLEFGLVIDDKESNTLVVGATSDAQRWPFLPGDRILSVGRPAETVRTPHELVTALRGRSGVVPVRVRRGGSEIEVQARPRLRPSVIARRGIVLDGALIAPQMFEDSTALREPAQLVIHSVESGSAAESDHLEIMDVIESVDGQRCENLDALIQHLETRAKDSPVRLLVRRSSPRNARWFDYHTSQLPGDEIEKIGVDAKISAADSRQ